jgi:hypothetical protein
MSPTPTLLLTGEADHRTPIAESEQYYQALKLQQVDAGYGAGSGSISWYCWTPISPDCQG